MTLEQDPDFQKMIQGQPYLETAPLSARRALVRDQLLSANRIADNDRRNAQIKALLHQVGQQFFVEPTFTFSYGLNLTIGDHFYANHDVMLSDEGRITIGDYVKFGPKVGLYTPIHPLDPGDRRTEVETTAPITIGNDVWVGGSATILPGVTLGNNVIVGAGSVVTHSFPDNVIVVGNPAKILRANPPKSHA